MIKFGTGGFRAIIGEDFTKDNVQQLARAVARKMKDENVENRTMVLGYDRRFLSKEATMWISEVLAYEGIKVLFIHRGVPTPLIMFEVKRLGLKPENKELTSKNNRPRMIRQIVDEEMREKEMCIVLYWNESGC